ncbi:MAG: FecR domain-containing protein [Gemmatimonadota bacterium]
MEEVELGWFAAKREGGILAASSPPSPDAIVALATRSPARRGHFSLDRPRAISLRSAGLLAACLAVVIGLSVASIGLRSGNSAVSQVVMTGVDEVVTVVLEDGTMVRLAPSSRLEFGAAQRTVALSGKAFFAVAHRDGDPFMVRLPERTITVLGTRFDAEGRDGQSRVAVIEGEVRISGNGPELTTRRNEVASGPDSAPLVLERVDDIYRTIDWLATFLAFEGTPLGEVADELRNRFGLRITIADSELSARTVTGWFTDQTPDQVITAICSAVGARCLMEGAEVQMEPAMEVASPSVVGRLGSQDASW